MNNQKPHIALTLLELANIIQQGRAIFPAFRFQSIDSSNEKSVQRYHSQVLEMFSALPSVNINEEQAFFVANTKFRDISLFEDSCFPTREVAIEDIIKVFPVTKQGQSIFLATQRLPDVILYDPIFESIWHDYFWKWQGYLVVKGAYQLANEFVKIEFPNKSCTEWKRLICLAKTLGLGNQSDELDKYGELTRKIIDSKRSVDKKHYNDETPISIFADFFKCVFEENDESDLRNTSRKFYTEFSKHNLSLSELASTSDFKNIIKELKTIYTVSHDSDFIGLLLFLFIRLQQRDGKLRKLIDFKSIFENQSGLSRESIKVAILLIGLIEPPDYINDFLLRNKNSFGIFSNEADFNHSTRIVPDSYFDLKVTDQSQTLLADEKHQENIIRDDQQDDISLQSSNEVNSHHDDNIADNEDGMNNQSINACSKETSKIQDEAVSNKEAIEDKLTETKKPRKKKDKSS